MSEDFVSYYRSQVDDSVTVAVNEVWINAIFISKEAALSWKDHWLEAEEKFKELNPPDGVGFNMVGTR